MADIPSNDDIIKLDEVRVNRNAGKVCTCKGDRDVMLNVENRQVYCGRCGALLDAFSTLHDMAMVSEWRNQQMERWLEQAEEIRNYKPWLKVIRNLERNYRGKKKVPVCPRCDEPFFLEELSTWMNRKFAEKQIIDKRKERG